MNKKKIKIALLCAIVTALVAICSGCNNMNENIETQKEYSNEVQVIVLLGQSNAEGHTWSKYLSKTMGEEKNKEYINGYDNVNISYACTIADNTSNGEFTPVKLGQGHSVNQFGPEIGIAEQLSKIDPKKKVYVIKYAYGGTSLTTQWRSPSSKNTGSLYTNAVNYVLEQCKKLEQMDLYPEIKAICWMQGEDDSSGNNFNSYEELERNFVNDLRKDLAYYKPANSEIGFVDGGISDCPAWTQQKVINEAKKKLSQENQSHIFIDTIAHGLKYNGEPAGMPDIYHYDSSSMIELGRLFAYELIANFIDVE